MKGVDTRIRIEQGDITEYACDAVVNAANKTLLGGGGVDGAIHRAAGPQLLNECRALGGCETGEARITSGYNLKAGYVVHTVGPVWKGGNSDEDRLLSLCYRNSMAIAVDKGLKSIAFPGISTGVYGFPFERACWIALQSVSEVLEDNSSVRSVMMVCFSSADYKSYWSIMRNLFKE
ncbi:MAG: O-acetyl-ADP-ribose deacetylase [Chitinivibrionales bacterium]